MFCRKNQWEAEKFPRELFGQSKSKRGRVLMHSKARRSFHFHIPRPLWYFIGAESQRY